MKKILSALLLLLMLTGAANLVTSCKDYDGDLSSCKLSIGVLRDSVSILDAKIIANEILTKAAQASADSAIKAAEKARLSGLDAAQQSEAAALAADAVLKSELTNAINAAKAEAIASAEAAALSAEQAAEAAAFAADEVLKQQTDQNIAKAKSDAIAAAKEYTNKNLTTIRDSIQKAYNDLAGLHTECTNLKSDINGLEYRIKNNEKSIVGLEKSIEDTQKDIENKYNDIKKRFNEMVSAYSTMITSVDIYYDVDDDGTVKSKSSLDFMLAEEQDNEFGPTGNTMKFTANKMAVYSDSLIIRVNPIAAKITKDMVKLMDSQNNNLDKFINIDSVEPYEDVLSRSTANGLWKIKFKLKEGYDAEALTKAVGATFNLSGAITKYRLFAIAVSTSKSDNLDARCVVSNYSLKVKTGLFDKATDLTVNNRSICEIKNRVIADGKGLGGTIADVNKQIDYLWKDATASKPFTGKPATKAITSGTDMNVAPVVFDVRNSKEDLNLGYDAAGKKYDMEFDFSSNGSTDGVRAFYVTLDEDYAWSNSGIDPTEREAWRRYHYTNLNTLIEGSTGTVSINETDEIMGEEIGFRVYAVNYDGTLVDPDGMAYYVTLGDVDHIVDQTVSGTITPDRVDLDKRSVVINLASQFSATSNYQFITYHDADYNISTDEWPTKTELINKYKAYAKPDAAGKYLPFYIEFKSEAGGAGELVEPAKAKSMVVSMSLPANSYLDDYTYSIPMSLVRKIGTDSYEKIYDVTIQITKKLPEVSGLKKMDETELADGETFTAYANNGITDNLWITKVDDGYIYLNKIFSNIDSDWSLTVKTGDKTITDNTEVKTRWIVDNQYILDDGENKEYTVEAVYSDPLSKQNKSGDTKKWVFSYKTKLVSWWYGATYSYAKDAEDKVIAPEITFNNSSEYKLDNIIATLKVSLPTSKPGLTVHDLLKNCYIWPAISTGSPKAELAGKGKNLFTCSVITPSSATYYVTFTPISGMESMGTFQDNLIISGIDCFGKTVKVSVPVTVNE